jgi:hypothetical protein
MRTTTGATAIGAAVAVTVIDLTVASAQVALSPPARLGEPRQTIVTSEVALDYQRDTVSVEGADDVTTSTYDLHAGFDRVMSHRITLGARVGFEGLAQGLDSRKRFDLGARAGALVPLGSSTIWWPTVGLAYGLTSYLTRDSNVSVRTVTLVASAPFLWQPARHLLVGVGPTYARDLQSKTGPDADQQGPSLSGFGVHGLLGLWF